MKLPESLQQKLNLRKEQNAFRELPTQCKRIDFASNDYLGFAQNQIIFNNTHRFLVDNSITINGATGSRLISGNHTLYQTTEEFIARFHQSETALIFNSGYDANVGFFSSVPQRNDIIFYDELCHASIRDGIQMSNAKSYKFQHNNFEQLEKLINTQLVTHNSQLTTFYVVTESVFSMDGDSPNLEELSNICEKYNCYLVVDEAHALGIFGDQGQGFVQSQKIQDKVFARIITFGKGLGCHGAAILGSEELKNYLINFARSFIYTTGLSPHAVATILNAYYHLAENTIAIENLKSNIAFFNQEKMRLGLKPIFVYSKSAIQCAIIPGNEKVKSIANQLQEKGFDVKAILSPTVPEGQERLRFCLHSYNSEKEIVEILQELEVLIFQR
jgi:8-amino-7-oxononanoate synthase